MKSVPSSYFSIVGISWPIVDNLLFHYASHHNVLEKMVMFESEKAAQEMRAKIKSKERTIESLAKELEDMKKSGSSSKDGRKELTVKEEIQGKSFVNATSMFPTISPTINLCFMLLIRCKGNEGLDGAVEGGN